MKKILGLLALLLCLHVGAQSSTNTEPSLTFVGLRNLAEPIKIVTGYLEANTNALKVTDWTFFGSYSKASGAINSSGFSMGGVYYVNQYVGTQIRGQYLDVGKGGGLNAVLLPNAAVTLSSTYMPFGKGFPLTIRPLVESGAAVNLKGDAYAILGAGGEVDFYSTTNELAAFQRLSAFYGVEQWSGPEKFTLTQIGVAANFNLEAVLSHINGWLKDIHL